MTDVARITAIHESGHFLVGYRMNWYHGMVSIEPDHAAGTEGYCHQEDSHWNVEQGQDQVTALCAGYAAVVASGIDHEIAIQGCESDFEKALEIIDFWELPSLEEQKASAVEWMRDDKNRKAVEAVADELMIKKTVHSELLDVIVEHADGECTDEELERIRWFLDRQNRELREKQALVQTAHLEDRQATD